MNVTLDVLDEAQKPKDLRGKSQGESRRQVQLSIPAAELDLFNRQIQNIMREIGIADRSKTIRFCVDAVSLMVERHQQ